MVSTAASTTRPQARPQVARTPTATGESGGESHTVRSGETMTSIAQARQLELQQLIDANPQVADPNKIRTGQSLNIPGTTTASAATDAASPATATATTAAAEATATTPATSADAETVRGARGRAVTADAAARARVEASVTSAESTPAADAKPLFSSGTIRRGAEGTAVTDLQQQLNARGASLEVDGDFGPSTQGAVRAFQREQGLTPDGVVGRNTRQAFRDTATQSTSTGPVDGAGNAPSAAMALRQGAEGPQVESLQNRLNAAADSGLQVDGDYGPATRRAVESFQLRAGLDPDGVTGPNTLQALDEVEAGTLTLADPPPPIINTGTGPTRPSGPLSQAVTVGDNTFNVHNMTRRDFGRRSVPGNRIISLDSNSASGRPGEVLRPLVVIPNNATPLERAAAQQAVDRVATWINENTPGGAQGRHATGIVRTTAQNGRGLSGFYHTEFHSVNDTEVTNLIRQRPQEYARILGETMGQIPGANFIVPHGTRNSRGIEDPGAVSADGSVSEIGLGRFLVEQGFKRL